MRDHILEYFPRALTQNHETGNTDVQYAEETLARLWENSGSAREEFREYPSIVRRAIGLGRSMLDPIALLSNLAGEGKEVRTGNSDIGDIKRAFCFPQFAGGGERLDRITI